MSSVAETSIEQKRCPGCSSLRSTFMGEYRSKLIPEYKAALHKCDKCKTWFTWPLNPECEIKKFYSEIFYDGVGKAIAEHRTAKEFMADGLWGQICKYIPCKGNVLDIGCGMGEWIQLLHDRCSFDDYFGVEYSEAMVEMCKNRCPWAHVYLSSAEDIKEALGDRKFNLISIIAVIEHLRNPRKVLEYISNHLEVGGRVIIVYPRIDSYPSKLMGKRWHLFSPVAHLTLFSRRGLTTLMKNLGLGILNVQPMQQYWSLQYVLSIAAYFFPSFRYFFSRLNDLRVVRNFKFSLYVGVDIIIAERQSIDRKIA